MFLVRCEKRHKPSKHEHIGIRGDPIRLSSPSHERSLRRLDYLRVCAVQIASNDVRRFISSWRLFQRTTCGIYFPCWRRAAGGDLFPIGVFVRVSKNGARGFPIGVSVALWRVTCGDFQLTLLCDSKERSKEQCMGISDCVSLRLNSMVFGDLKFYSSMCNTGTGTRFLWVLRIPCGSQNICGFVLFVLAPGKNHLYMLETPVFLDFQSWCVAFLPVPVFANGFHNWAICGNTHAWFLWRFSAVPENAPQNGARGDHIDESRRFQTTV